MEWIYNDYEFENRVKNLAWTISGNYNKDIFISEEYYGSKNIELYIAIMSGARYKYVKWDEVEKYLSNRISKGYDSKIIIGLVQVILNKMVEEKLINDRPGIKDIRKEAYKDILDKLKLIYKDDLIQKIKYVFMLEGMGKHPVIDGISLKVVNSIKSIDLNQSIIETLNDIDKIYLQFFRVEVDRNKNGKENYIEKNIESNISTFSDFMYEELYEKDKSELIKNEINKLSPKMLIEGSIEANENINSNSNDRIIYIDKESLDKIYRKMEYYYGKSYLSKSEVKKIESRNCRKIHEGCRVHFTDGVLRSKCENTAKVKYVIRQKENNIKKFSDNVKIHKRNILKLKESLSRVLIEENESSRVYPDYGTVCANRVWRVIKSNNKKIFYKDIKNEKGKFVIDILLDSSGSQIRNQANVAIQAYTIACSLTMMGIPNRVMGFSSFMDYTIIKKFKDYEDKLSETENIFEYFCAGNNRDGLAIKSVCDKLSERREENKILIVLSDGKPNDVKIGKDREHIINTQKAYKGTVGIKDTASEIRRARQQGILVLGVFTGSESDLQSQRYIYGKDFVYIKNIDRFSDIVSMYLKKIIRN